jgi:hypothetical protein
MNEYDQLFASYVVELRDSMARALAWWEEMITREAVHVGSIDEAMSNIRRRWPFGPASHPYVIATYRKYFLACELLNEHRRNNAGQNAINCVDSQVDNDGWGIDDVLDAPGDVAGPMHGWILLVDRLRGSHNDLAEFLNGLVLQPIGTDSKTGQFI